ncbi:pentapeptide repeat-containing protein [Desertifilum sp. FACHB-1129]|uniref:Low-complexity protein n=1 Tax=Desertifilum tharense IPPAS B-1220 TaxID=1781255 RepID=A0A1E5QDA2_9CYAN|nr:MULTISPECIES: pentapeptide repeat-containing protein [Desertifilum]MDA0212358.1 pentapeptide repeat-containing protein [Cyanobacteria bacterium FC1]MBD2311311.1 pentapeptide repeat-containing protein [Desertifilum sp. FACHB-1129]MBD2321557.1 pentapeptide repeat-containing protein [Desertifilum sp. FACHB-866]MBD2331684.1 pentapeptide repeat-containing protein [Desertifilum sp. FACHB-868]OEJ72638.1 hypothetical protein BH720_24390 [Desertifilum tharense IPPAS B-1220]
MSHLDYANQNLQNRSFKGLDLAGVDFSCCDLRGCNFTGANLTGANLQGCITGQSRRQVYQLIAVAIAASVAVVGFSILLSQVVMQWFGDISATRFNFILYGLALAFSFLFRQGILPNIPLVPTVFGLAALTLLLAAMSLLTVGLFFVVLSNFSDGAIAPGFFLLGVMALSGFICFWVLRWLIQSIRTHPGTSFHKANLTQADLSYSKLQNADFSLANLTGACIFDWEILGDNRFLGSYCEYLYIGPALQNRQPLEGNFQPGEWERLVAKWMSQT